MLQESDCFHNTVLGIKHPSRWKWRYASVCGLHKCRRKSATGSHEDEVIYSRWQKRNTFEWVAFSVSGHLFKSWNLSCHRGKLTSCILLISNMQASCRKYWNLPH